ncbi:MAG: Rid family detoxifying hydrolase [Acidobacteria bacterium]|nr:Rid family detoxifying hydrolase [Acidobacteriota bacterium]
MDREVITSSQLPAVNSTYSQAIKANGLVFVAGQIGMDPITGEVISGDMAEQTRQALENLALILQAAGSSLDKVLSASLYLTEFDQLHRVNEVYGEYFKHGGPAKFACGVSELYGGAKIEIQAIALA